MGARLAGDSVCASVKLLADAAHRSPGRRCSPYCGAEDRQRTGENPSDPLQDAQLPLRVGSLIGGGADTFETACQVPRVTDAVISAQAVGEQVRAPLRELLRSGQYGSLVRIRVNRFSDFGRALPSAAAGVPTGRNECGVRPL
jgi:hypothetical protein